jgi:hypothetical protein
MMRLGRIWSVVALLIFVIPAFGLADGNLLQQVRYSMSPEQVRLVFDLEQNVEAKQSVLQDPLRIVVEFPGNLGPGVQAHVELNDPFVSGLELQQVEPGKIKAVISLKMAAVPKVYSLQSPNRLVVDLSKIYEQKTEEMLAPGVKHISWLRSESGGPVWAHILVVSPKANVQLKPVVANRANVCLETLSDLVVGTGALAAVNGSFFADDGEIIGLLKVNGKIISTSSIPRTAFGILPGGQLIFDQVGYQGKISFPDGTTATIDGVNRQRGDNEIILYNEYNGSRTGTNTYGVDYTLGADGKLVAISTGNSPLLPGAVVLSAHGDGVKAFVHAKQGDVITVSQTLGALWDKAMDVVGVGPMLLKGGNIFLTTKIEDFGTDVAGGRAPRTALGVTADGSLLLVVVDGRESTSTGLTLLELAMFMQELKAVDAMNLDGGGSSTMVIGTKVINKPSDGFERKVGDGLLLVPVKLAN